MTQHFRFAARETRMKASEIRELLKLLDRPDIISFAGGIPDAALFPVREFPQLLDRESGSEPCAARSRPQWRSFAGL